MQFTPTRRAFGIAAALTVAFAAAPALTHGRASADGTITITGTWTRATPAGAKVAGGYLTITNSGKDADTLIGGTLATAAKVELHEMSLLDGVMRMKPLEQGVEIKPGETVEFKPGGYHVMFIGLSAPVTEGEMLAGTLIFQRAGTIAIHYHAAGIGAAAPGPMEHGDHAGHAMPKAP